MARKSAARRQVEEPGNSSPERPDRIPPQEGDTSGEVVDIGTGKSSPEETVDVNAVRTDDDARSDADKARERQLEKDEEERRAAAGNEPPPRTEDEEETERRPSRSRVRQRRDNRAAELARKSEEKVSNLTRALGAANERIAKLERAGDEKGITATIAQLEAKIKEITTQLAAAKEAGNTTEDLALTIKLGEVQGELALARRDLQVAKARPAVDPGAADNRGAGDDKEDDKRPEIVEDWMTANRRWWNLPSAEALRKAAVVLDNQIREEIRDGELDIDEYSEAHMDELTMRLADEQERLGLDFEIRDFEGEVFIPEEEPDPSADRERGERHATAANGRDKGNDVRGRDRGTRRAPQGGMGGRDGRRGAQSDLELAKQGKARLTDEDYEQMRIFKLNPNDPEVKKRFAKERVRTILTEASKAGK